MINADEGCNRRFSGGTLERISDGNDQQIEDQSGTVSE